MEPVIILFRACVSFLKVLSYQMHRCMVDFNSTDWDGVIHSGYSKSYFRELEFTGVMLTWHALIDFCYVTSSQKWGLRDPRSAQGEPKNSPPCERHEVRTALYHSTMASHKQTYDSGVKLKVKKKKPICALFFLILPN